MQSGLLTGAFTVSAPHAAARRLALAHRPNSPASSPATSGSPMRSGSGPPRARRAAVAIAWTLAWPGVTGAIVAARRKAAPEIEWRHQDLASWRPEQTYDLIYSNAALHWLPDHAALFPALMRKVAPGGILRFRSRAISSRRPIP